MYAYEKQWQMYVLMQFIIFQMERCAENPDGLMDRGLLDGRTDSHGFTIIHPIWIQAYKKEVNCYKSLINSNRDPDNRARTISDGWVKNKQCPFILVTLSILRHDYENKRTVSKFNIRIYDSLGIWSYINV